MTERDSRVQEHTGTSRDFPHDSLSLRKERPYPPSILPSLHLSPSIPTKNLLPSSEKTLYSPPKPRYRKKGQYFAEPLRLASASFVVGEFWRRRRQVPRQVFVLL